MYFQHQNTGVFLQGVGGGGPRYEKYGELVKNLSSTTEGDLSGCSLQVYDRE